MLRVLIASGTWLHVVSCHSNTGCASQNSHSFIHCMSSSFHVLPLPIIHVQIHVMRCSFSLCNLAARACVSVSPSCHDSAFPLAMSHGLGSSYNMIMVILLCDIHRAVLGCAPVALPLWAHRSESFSLAFPLYAIRLLNEWSKSLKP